MNIHNLIAFFITATIAVAWLRINDAMAKKGWIDSHLSRKLIHAGTGPFFLACWPLFTNDMWGRAFAALIPLIITIQFFLVGAGVIKDDDAVRAMSRSGDRQEILRGPLIYGIAFILLTLIFWYTTPIGVVSLMILCGGDAFADIIGRRSGVIRLPWNRNKTWTGSIAMFIGGFAFSAIMVGYFVAIRFFPLSLVSYLPGITITSLVCAAVESLPIPEYDNLTVTLAAVILGFLFF